MGYMIEFIVKGGAFSYVILLLGLTHIIASTGQLAVYRRYNIVPLLLALVVTILLAGALGNVHLVREALVTVAAATPLERPALLASGISISIYSNYLSLSVGLLTTLLTGVVATVMKNRRPDPVSETRF